MLIHICQTAIIGAFTTETANLIIKSEQAHIRICDKGIIKRLVLPYSYEQNLNTITVNIHHN
jgi:hypothetical protein